MGSPHEVALLGSTDGTSRYNYTGGYEAIRSTQGKQHVVLYVWNAGTLAYEVATTTTFGGGGGGGGSATSANQTTEIAKLQALLDLLTFIDGQKLAKIMAADDYNKQTNWALTSGQYRVSSIVHSSASLGLSVTHTKTYADAGTSDEREINDARS